MPINPLGIPSYNLATCSGECATGFPVFNSSNVNLISMSTIDFLCTPLAFLQISVHEHGSLGEVTTLPQLHNGTLSNGIRIDRFEPFACALWDKVQQAARSIYTGVVTSKCFATH